ncbi:hypothetical protein [Kitasatospora sp. NPDC091207]|uniref:hypothetical protein n=1 Tax=Kitasatospora sp. NPDC091207 TaxID=3364083 RepID=UPI0038162CC8
MLLAALAARWAAIEGNYEAVDDFTRDVLGHANAVQWRDAVIDALPGDWVDRLGSYLTDPEPLAILHRCTAAERRRWTEPWERKAAGFRRKGRDGVVRTSTGTRVGLLEAPNE